MNPRPDLYVVVVGCGRFGRHLATALSREGCSVVVVDRVPRRLAALDPDFGGFRIEGDGTEPEILRRAKCGDADLVIAATDSDSANLLIAQVARRIMGARRAVARLQDPARISDSEALGIETICPPLLAISRLLVFP